MVRSIIVDFGLDFGSTQNAKLENARESSVEREVKRT
jgi:hypothetical protein